MKKILFLILLLSGLSCRAQSYELQRLVLDIKKLAELKNILNDLYQGYAILSQGYNTIKEISQGNFTLHQAFLDGLLLVNPAVKNYHRVAEILDFQARILSGYKMAFNRFKQDGHFTPTEILYLGQVYSSLVDKTEKNLGSLLDILTAGTLRMSDDQRLRAIDQLYDQSKEQWTFLSQFNSSTAALGLQRALEQQDAGTLRNYYPLK